jgi:hypothetical protein
MSEKKYNIMGYHTGDHDQNGTIHDQVPSLNEAKFRVREKLAEYKRMGATITKKKNDPYYRHEAHFATYKIAMWIEREIQEFPYGEFQDGRQWNDPEWEG